MRLFVPGWVLVSWGLKVWARSDGETDGDGDGFCYGGCDLVLSGLVFNDTAVELTTVEPGSRGGSALRSGDGNITSSSDSVDARRCSNAYRLPSLYLCLQRYCSEGERVKGLSGLNETCGRGLPAFEDVLARFGDEEMERLRRVGREDLVSGGKRMGMGKMVVREAVVVGESVWGLGRGTLAAWDFETRIHNVYGCAMYIFWAVIILIGLSSHLGQYLLSTSFRNPEYQSLPYEDGHDTDRGTFDTPYIFLKKYITVPATFGYRRAQNVGWCTIPTRVQSLAIVAFVVMNVVLCSCSYWTFEGNMYWPNPRDQFLRYFADRTGIISTANLILVWTFGIRNNTLLWLTGWDFAAYSMFHRWVARVATVQAVLHSVVYTVLIVIAQDSWSEAWTYYLAYFERSYFWNGVLATIFMVFILVASVYPLRRNFYEIFLWLHIILSILILLTIHVVPFRNYALYIYPCVIIWLFDRLLRILRILSFNPRFWDTKATIAYSPDSNIVHMSVPYSKAWMKPRPGGFYYVYFLSADRWWQWRGWESHPFTLAYSTPLETEDGVLRTTNSHSPSMSLGTINPPSRVGSPISQSHNIESASLLPPSPFPSAETAPPATLNFLIRPYDGFTSRLRASALRSGTSGTRQRVLIEGPYGETQPFRKYRNVLFVVGGTGIAVPMSYLRGLASFEQSDGDGTRNQWNDDVRTRRIRIMWAVREETLLDELLEGNMEAILGSRSDVDEALEEKLKIRAFITRHAQDENKNVDVELREGFSSIPFSEPVSSIQEANEAEAETPGRNPRVSRRGIEIVRGRRPDVFAEIEGAVRRTGGEPLAVVVCGPPVMADDARRTVVELLGTGKGGVGGGGGGGRGRIEYFEESFNW
ncbi:uncharacterized protein RAG0_02410 [Rhynchosporium agropyri]|uniref:FAD-binding FR-type domain-containing protein n=1 Tax=Rhynchosporium agropyri TaxID=914238 RepID=A0A1E1K1J5_9HELO|nr:uncharacterized protein RAG0_02410 [Rhynchosporium agropyri]